MVTYLVLLLLECWVVHISCKHVASLWLLLVPLVRATDHSLHSGSCLRVQDTTRSTGPELLPLDYQHSKSFGEKHFKHFTSITFTFCYWTHDYIAVPDVSVPSVSAHPVAALFQHHTCWAVAIQSLSWKEIWSCWAFYSVNMENLRWYEWDNRSMTIQF